MRLQVGDVVEVVDQTHSWGRVKRGDIGVVQGIDARTGTYKVGFPSQSGWSGFENCFKLVNEQLEND